MEAGCGQNERFAASSSALHGRPFESCQKKKNTNKINVFLQSLCQSLRENRVLEADGLVSVYLNPAVASVNTAG